MCVLVAMLVAVGCEDDDAASATAESSPSESPAPEPQAVFEVGRGWDTRFHAGDSLELRFKPEPRDEVIYGTAVVRISELTRRLPI